MPDLSYVIDPGGDPSRAGINLRVFPSGQTPLEQDGVGTVSERLANNELAPFNLEYRYEFTFEAVVTMADFGKLRATIQLLQERANQLGQWELVIYNFAEPFTEVGPGRTRYLAPGTSVITQEDLGDGQFYWEYFVALQGGLQLLSSRQYGSHMEVSLGFTEGTVLEASLEP